MRAFWRIFKKEETGATAIEYGLIAAGISLAIVGAVFLFGDELGTLYDALVPAAQAIADNVETGR